MKPIELLKAVLLQIVSDIDAGNSNMDEKECIEMLQVVKKYNDKFIDKELTCKEVCDTYHISRQTLYRKVNEGKIPPATKIAGKNPYWKKSVLDKYLS